LEKYEMVYGKGSAYTREALRSLVLNVDILGRLQKPSFKPEESMMSDISKTIKTYRKLTLKT
jgi:hypothetical protein